MTRLSRQDVAEILEPLVSSGAAFYHACQLRDLRTYLKLGCIPSRRLLKDSGLAFTRFDTDLEDQKRGVWSKVFGNLSDSGTLFAQSPREKALLPNPYGPIMLRFSLQVLCEADDVAVSMRDEVPYRYGRVSLDKTQIIGLFERTDWRTRNLEVCCTVPAERFSFQLLESVVVDSYVVEDVSLIDLVTSEFSMHGIPMVPTPRPYLDGACREQILLDLAIALAKAPIALNAFEASNAICKESKYWALVVGPVYKKEWLFNRFAKYLREGTLKEMMSSATAQRDCH